MSTSALSQESFLRLFLQYEDDLKSYARSLLPTRDAVGEVMQEASVVMWRKLDQLSDESGFLPWSKVIVRFEVLKARQTAARDRLCFSEKVFELLAEDDFSADGEAMVREREALGQCLGKFDSAQRELVLLPHCGRGAVTDLAAKSDRSVNSLYKKIGRLREKLTQCIERELARPELEGGLP